MTKVTGFICCSRVYKYNGWLFEWSTWSGPWPLKKNGWELRKRAGRKFFKDIDKFCAMGIKERKKYIAVDGGCIPI